VIHSRRICSKRKSVAVVFLKVIIELLCNTALPLLYRKINLLVVQVEQSVVCVCVSG